MTDIIPVESIASRIFLIRGMKVILDRDLAELFVWSRDKGINPGGKKKYQKISG
jgi:hypothetical protein